MLLFLWALALERLVSLGDRADPLDLFLAGDYFTPFGWFALAGVLFVAVTESDRTLDMDAMLLRKVLLWGPLLLAGLDGGRPRQLDPHHPPQGKDARRHTLE